jgi:hypothetical protein
VNKLVKLTNVNDTMAPMNDPNCDMAPIQTNDLPPWKRNTEVIERRT